jgi:GWxTD domain-containing protein
MSGSRRRLRVVSLVAFALSACGGGTPAATPRTTPSPRAAPAPQVPIVPQFDQAKLYQQLGLLAHGAPMPFVGGVAFYATASRDSTHVVLAVSMSNSALTFARENDRFRAGYTVNVALAEGGATVKQDESHESVLVPSFKETSRIDQSVIFQDILTLKPGRYRLTVTVRDDGSSRSSTEDVTLGIPALGPGSLSSPVSFAQVAPRITVDSLPRVVTTPAASVTFGRDTVVGVYIEGYSSATDARLPVAVSVRTEDGRPLFGDTLTLAHRANLYSGVVNVPVARIGIGPSIVAFWQPGQADTSRVPIFVGFGPDLPVASYDEMLNYLRWFALPEKLKSLRDTAPELRAKAWGAFVKQSGTILNNNDALQDYFRRFVLANARYSEEGQPGWLTDRGKVLLGLGEPDQLYEQTTGTSFGQRGRTQIWEYRDLAVQLVFLDQTGFGRWRLQSSSEVQFQSAWRRRVQQR